MKERLCYIFYLHMNTSWLLSLTLGLSSSSAVVFEEHTIPGRVGGANMALCHFLPSPIPGAIWTGHLCPSGYSNVHSLMHIHCQEGQGAGTAVRSWQPTEKFRPCLLLLLQVEGLCKSWLLCQLYPTRGFFYSGVILVGPAPDVFKAFALANQHTVAAPCKGQPFAHSLSDELGNLALLTMSSLSFQSDIYFKATAAVSGSSNSSSKETSSNSSPRTPTSHEMPEFPSSSAEGKVLLGLGWLLICNHSGNYHISSASVFLPWWIWSLWKVLDWQPLGLKTETFYIFTE